MKYPITLDALEVLDAIERKGSFAAAANELFRVPSAVSYSIQKLEQGREILQATERLAMTTKKTHSGWEAVFNIAIDSILDFEFIYPLIAQFYEIQPDIEINIYEEVLGGTHEALFSNRADLVIGVAAEPTLSRNIQYQKIREIDWLFVVPPWHELTQATLPLSQALMRSIGLLWSGIPLNNKPHKVTVFLVSVLCCVYRH